MIVLGIRIARPCYDKYRRCPGWAGSGFRFNKPGNDWCESGTAPWEHFTKSLWQWRPWRCETCGTIVLPSHIRWIAPSWWRFMIQHRVSNWWEDRAKYWLWFNLSCRWFGHRWGKKLHGRICTRCYEYEAY